MPADLFGRLADETDDLCPGRSSSPDVSGERHARLPGSNDNRPCPAPDLPQRHLVEHARIKPHGDELHVGEYRSYEWNGERNGVDLLHDAEAPGTYREHGDEEPAGCHGRSAQHADTLVDARVTEDALVHPVPVQEQHERERREYGERPDDYEGVDEHRRPAPERRRRAMEGPLQPVHRTQEPLPDPLQKPHRLVY